VGIVQQVYEPFGQLCFQPGFCLPGNEQPGFEGDPRAEEPCHLVLKKAAAHLLKTRERRQINGFQDTDHPVGHLVTEATPTRSSAGLNGRQDSLMNLET
jgi:hypothetical protein